MNAAPAQFSIFGGIERARAEPPRRSARPMGYAAPPGTGPAGETCGSCAHCRTFQRRGGSRWRKCALMMRAWSHYRGTDILLRSPACRAWRAGTPSPAPGRFHPTR